MLESEENKFEGKTAMFTTLIFYPAKAHHCVTVHFQDGTYAEILVDLRREGEEWCWSCGKTSLSTPTGRSFSQQFAFRAFERSLIEKINRGARP